ncbi:MAG: hypothetical protein ACR2PO_05015 [Methyloligellaceae bacterium]
MKNCITTSLVAFTMVAGAGLATEKAAAEPGAWFAVGGCYKSGAAANRQAARLGVNVVDTNDYPNFRNGWYCAAIGPFDRRNAELNRQQFVAQGVYDAYVKRGW